MSKRTLAVARAVGVIGATAAVIIGVTFATGLSSQATLNNNTLSSANASLLLWNGSSFASTAPGFTVTGLVPGHGSGPLPFYFQNNGGVDLDITAHVPAAPSSSGFSGWQNLTLHINNDATHQAIDTTMQDLLNGQVSLPGNPLPAGSTGNSNVAGTPGNYTATWDIVPASVTGNQVTVGSFDIVFTGTQH